MGLGHVGHVTRLTPMPRDGNVWARQWHAVRVSETFVLRQRPPLRALLISSVVAVVGAAGTVLALALDWASAVLIIAVVLLVAGLLLGVVAVVTTRRLMTTVALDAGGYLIMRPGRRARGNWSDVAKVTLEGPALTLLPSADATTGDTIICLRGPDDPTFAALAAAVRDRLEADRA